MDVEDPSKDRRDRRNDRLLESQKIHYMFPFCAAAISNATLGSPEHHGQMRCPITYSQTLPQHIIRQKVTEVFEDIGAEFEDSTGNLRAQPGIYPDYAAPILRAKPGGGLVLSKVRWGMPSPQKILEGKRTDPGVTNIRNTASPHWRCWLASSTKALYTAAQQITDWGTFLGPGDSLDLRIYQLSALIGRSAMRSVTLSF